MCMRKTEACQRTPWTRTRLRCAPGLLKAHEDGMQLRWRTRQGQVQTEADLTEA